MVGRDGASTNSMLGYSWIFGGCFLTACIPPGWSHVYGLENSSGTSGTAAAAAALPDICPDFEEATMLDGYESYTEYYSCRVLPGPAAGEEPKAGR